MAITVKKRFLRIAPRKVRLVIDLIRKMNVNVALSQLAFINKQAAKPVACLLSAALSAAKEKDMNLDTVFIKEARVDEGPRLKRRQLISRGRSTSILKRACHISITVDENTDKKNIKKTDNKKSLKKDK